MKKRILTLSFIATTLLMAQDATLPTISNSFTTTLNTRGIAKCPEFTIVKKTYNSTKTESVLKACLLKDGVIELSGTTKSH